VKALEQSTPAVNKSARAAFGTFGWLLLKYYDSAEFKRLPLDSRRTRRGILEHCANEGYASRTDKRKMRDFPVASMTAAHIRMLRDRKADRPGASKHRLQYLSSMLAWAVEANLVRSNVTRDVKPIRYETEGFTPGQQKRFSNSATSILSAPASGLHSKSSITSVAVALNWFGLAPEMFARVSSRTVDRRRDT
jgi:hypothetical protein